MIAALLSALLPAGIKIAQELTKAKTARANAQTDTERIAADERIAALDAQKAVLAAESGSGLNAIVRALFALPVAIYFAKLFVWDKVLGLGATDPLSPELWQIAITVIGFYFVSETVTRTASIIRRR